MDNNGWVDETLPLRVLHRVRVSVAAGLRMSDATEPEVRRLPSRRIARRSVASAGAFATALTAVLGGAVGTAAAAPAAPTKAATGSSMAGSGPSGSATPTPGKAPKGVSATGASSGGSSSGSAAPVSSSPSTTGPATTGSPNQTAVSPATTSSPNQAVSSPAAMPSARTTSAPSPAAGSTKSAAPKSTKSAAPKSGKAGSAAASAATSGGTLCDSSGSGEAIFANVSPTPAFNEGQPTGGGIVAAGTTLSATYFDEAGFHTTGTISGPFTTKPGSSSYPLTPTISTLPVTPATSRGSKSGVQLSATVPKFTAPVAANTWYALTISVADNDDKVPAPCTVQWLVSATPPPAPGPRPTPAPAPTPTPAPTPAPTVAPSAITPPPPTVQITKLNNAAGTGYGVSETAAPGSTSVPYRVTVTNPNASPGTLTVLTDTIDGVTTNICPPLIGTVLAPSGQPNDSVTCNFTGPVPKAPTVDTAGTTLSVNGVLASATAQSTVFPPVLGTQIVPPPSTPAATPAPATLAFTGAPVGKMLAAALGMIALGLALLAGLQLVEGERRPWRGLTLASLARTPGAARATRPGWPAAPIGRSGDHSMWAGPPTGREWLLGYIQGGWTRLRGRRGGPDGGVGRPEPPFPEGYGASRGV